MKRITVTLPDELDEELRAQVPKGRLSAFMADAARFLLAWERQEKALEIGRGAWSDEDYPDLQTPEDSVRFVRKLREMDNERLARLEKYRDQP